MLTVSSMSLPPSNLDSRLSLGPPVDYGTAYRAPPSQAHSFSGGNPMTPASSIASPHMGYSSPQPRQSNHLPPDGPGPSDWEQRESMSRLRIHNDSDDMQGVESGIRRVEYEDGRIGVEPPDAPRKYQPIKVVGDGSFGTVWLCDWSSPLAPGTTLSAMQCGAGARPEWAGKKLVALKRMKRVWEGGWKQARDLGELVSLRHIPPHPAIIPLYDAFLQPSSKELYFVFECMEGNLYQLTKSRKGRPLAGGLIASVFHQIVSGLHHIHLNGYFHRDMKPENLLVTTTGLQEYLSSSALKAVNANGGRLPSPNSTAGSQIRYEKDVAVIVKLADFGLARATTSAPPYTEYVSTRWYRAPEVLLRSREYSAPVDMWALGTILAEMINLKPLFPGQSEVDQVYRICEVLGDPSRDYGVDERGRLRGGGDWDRGIKMAKAVGFAFPKKTPVNFTSLFPDTVPISLIDCMADLLRYHPRHRMTSQQCIEHAYFHETLPHLQLAHRLPSIPFSKGQPFPSQAALPNPMPVASPVPPRSLPPSHSHAQTISPAPAKPIFADGDLRTLPPPLPSSEGPSPVSNSANNSASRLHLFPDRSLDPAPERRQGASTLVDQLRELDLPTADLSSYGHRAPLPKQNASYGFGVDEAAAVPPRQGWEASQYAQEPRRSSAAQSTQYDGSVFEGSSHEQSASSFTKFDSLSSSNLQQQRQAEGAVPYGHGLPPHMLTPTALASGGYSQPQRASPDQTRIAPPSEVDQPMRGADPAKLGVAPKKKKWGLSSVFGGGDSRKHQSEAQLAVPTDSRMTGSSSLKRTQSGHAPSDRMMASMSQLPSVNETSAAPLDPKKAKKEAERQARELERAKRDAAERAQKERARAVLQKRNQLVEARKMTGTRDEIEYGEGHNFNVPKAASGGNMQQPILSNALRNVAASSSDPSRSSAYAANLAGSASLTSVRSHGSYRSGASHQSNSSLYLHEMPDDPSGGSAYRKSKSVKRGEGDDHSMSDYGMHHHRNSSALTVDSDPGPRSRQYNRDPAINRAPSINSFNHPHASRSSSSVDNQLARDFQAHAIGASSSATSLGRHGASSLSLNSHTHLSSAPPSPYGQPKGLAVTHGSGLGRSGTTLPSISSWENITEEPSPRSIPDIPEGSINPMFRVQTLPPFAAIASVAGSHPRSSHSQTSSNQTTK